jgi:hypothetical protein
MSRWYCPECDPERLIRYKSGGPCPCSDEKERIVDLIEIKDGAGSDSLRKANQKIFMAETK